MSDLIDRQAAIELIERMKPYHQNADDIAEMIANMPSAQTERLTDDDFETIRIHLSAFKEKLCNQRRWGEAEEYEQLIARFMAFASVQQEIVRCKDCTKCQIDTVFHDYWCDGRKVWKNHYCGYAERRADE